MGNRKIYIYVYSSLFFIIILLSSLVFFDKVSRANPIEISYANKITYTAYFKENGASLETKKVTCVLNNNECLITFPIATRNDGFVVGYNLDKNSNSALYQIGETININKNTVFYVISYQELSLKIINNKIDYLGEYDNKCIIYNEEKSCNIKMPYFNKVGYEVRGYSPRKDSMTGIVYPDNNYKLTKNTTLYPIYNLLTRGIKIDIYKNYKIGNMVFDIEKGCDENIYNNYLYYFNRISERAKYLFVGSKITFLNDDTFNYIWGNEFVGMNYGPNGLRLIDVRCSNTYSNNYYATIVHEMAHSWDLYYGNFTGKDISEQSDIINLYNKYKNSSNRPFREYSYTDIKEFVADMVRYHYLKYIEPNYEYKGLIYPEDIKKVLEKYICIANNNYDSNKCN